MGMENMIIHGGDIYRNKVDIDFSVNLNPLGIQPMIRDAIARSAELAGVYPDPGQEEVRAVIADAEGLSPECVYAGAGASELIQAAVRAKSPEEALSFANACGAVCVTALGAGTALKNREQVLKFMEETPLKTMNVSGRDG